MEPPVADRGGDDTECERLASESVYASARQNANHRPREDAIPGSWTKDFGRGRGLPGTDTLIGSWTHAREVVFVGAWPNQAESSFSIASIEGTKK
jgi:hypothetical protein